MSSSFNLLIRYSDGEIASYTPLASELDGMLFSKWFYDKDEEEFKNFFKDMDESPFASPDSSYGIAVIDFVSGSVHDCQHAAEISFVGSSIFSLMLNHKVEKSYDVEELIKKNTFEQIETPDLKNIYFDTRSIDEWKKRTLKGHFLVFMDKPFTFNWYNTRDQDEKRKMYEWIIIECFPLTEIDHKNWDNFIYNKEE